MRCLVTGATGFFGSHLTRLLSQRGHEVAILKRANSDSWRIADVLPDIRIVSGDLSDLASAREQILGCRPEAVLHLGWQGVQSRFRNDRIQSDNIGQAAELLAISHEAGCRTWIGFGSQAEYGPKQEAIRETEPPAPTTLYGMAKLATMEMSRAVSALLDMRWVWLRVFSLYGPADEPSWMLPSLIQQLLKRQKPPLTLGTQLWDYLYVEEAAEAVVQLMETPAAGGLFNLGSGQARPLRQIVEELRDIIDPSLPLGFGEVEFRSDQVMHLEADITRLQEAVAWRPRPDYRAGLRATVAWHSARFTENEVAL
jgi:nucleoside-diphosphate-sugar epimerase